MAGLRRSDVGILVAAGVIALALPLAGARVVSAKLHGDVEPTLSAALGEAVTIDGVEATLTGAVRLRNVRVGGLFTARTIEASIGLDSLLRGRFTADEIRIEAPRLRTRVDRSGERKLRRLVQRAAAARRRAGAGRGRSGARRLRRVLVTGGELRVDLEGRGVLRAHDVQLHPQAGGVRLVTGAVDVDLLGDETLARGRFDRLGADVALPDLSLRRALAVDGAITLTGPRVGAVRFVDVIASKGVDRDAPGRVELVARVAGNDPNARARLVAGDGAVDVSGTGVPLAVLAPFAPRWLYVQGATATGTVRLVPGDGRLSAQLDLSTAGVVVAHPKISAEPLAVEGSIAGRAHVERGDAGDALHLDELALTTRGVTVTLSGTAAGLDGDLPRAVALRAELAPTPCMTALRAIPRPARRRLAGLTARGELSGRVALSFERADPDATRLDVAVDVEGCEVLREATAADPAALREPFEHTFPDGSTATVGPGRNGYVRYRHIPALVARAFVAAEDARFFEHSGFDPDQIEASLAVDISERELLRGGSTITQQLAKNVFLDPERTFARKLEEAVLAWRLEQRLDKRDILELYLNVIELGEGVFGVGDAARYWFGKSLRELDAREVAFLAALTPAPRTISRRVRRHGAVDPETAERIDVVLRHMRDADAITPATYRRARASRLQLSAPLLTAALDAEE